MASLLSCRWPLAEAGCEGRDLLPPAACSSCMIQALVSPIKRLANPISRPYRLGLPAAERPLDIAHRRGPGVSLRRDQFEVTRGRDPVDRHLVAGSAHLLLIVGREQGRDDWIVEAVDEILADP